MKHINLTNWTGTITEWTELNYVKGGLADAYAEIANVSGNYLRYSNNICDEEFEIGGINTNGILTTETKLRTANFIPVKPNTTYYAWLNNTNDTFAVHGYYADKTGRPADFTTISGQGTFTTKSDVYYIKVNFSTAYGTTYLNDFMIVEGSTAPTTYEPYGSLVIEDNENEQIIVVPE